MQAVRRFSRRTFLKSAGAAGSLAAMGPWVVADAQSSSGALNILNWATSCRIPVLPNFEKAPGIKVNPTPFSQNEEQINKLQATGGEGFDLCHADARSRAAVQGPRRARAVRRQQARQQQEPDPVACSKARHRDWTWDGSCYHVPHCWGSEAISWRNDQTTLEYKTLSYGTLWNEEYKGKVQGRPHSLLLGIGLWLDRTGKLPSNRMPDAFKDEET